MPHQTATIDATNPGTTTAHGEVPKTAIEPATGRMSPYRHALSGYLNHRPTS
jgi:hypothetical protein